MSVRLTEQFDPRPAQPGDEERAWRAFDRAAAYLLLRQESSLYPKEPTCGESAALEVAPAAEGTQTTAAPKRRERKSA